MKYAEDERSLQKTAVGGGICHASLGTYDSAACINFSFRDDSMFDFPLGKIPGPWPRSCSAPEWSSITSSCPWFHTYKDCLWSEHKIQLGAINAGRLFVGDSVENASLGLLKLGKVPILLCLLPRPSSLSSGWCWWYQSHFWTRDQPWRKAVTARADRKLSQPCCPSEHGGSLLPSAVSEIIVSWIHLCVNQKITLFALATSNKALFFLKHKLS